MESVVAQASSVNGVTGPQANVGQTYQDGDVPKSGDVSYQYQSAPGWSETYTNKFHTPYWTYHDAPTKAHYKYVWHRDYMVPIDSSHPENGRYIGQWIAEPDHNDPYWAPNGQDGAYSGTPGYVDSWVVPPNAEPPPSYYPPVVVPPVRSDVYPSVFNRYVQDLDQDGIPDVLQRRRHSRGRRRHFFFF